MILDIGGTKGDRKLKNSWSFGPDCTPEVRNELPGYIFWMGLYLAR